MSLELVILVLAQSTEFLVLAQSTEFLVLAQSTEFLALSAKLELLINFESRSEQDMIFILKKLQTTFFH